jgi:hypothetical protein
MKENEFKLYQLMPDNTEEDRILMPIRIGTCKLFKEPDGTKVLYANDKGKLKRFLIDESDC